MVIKLRRRATTRFFVISVIALALVAGSLGILTVVAFQGESRISLQADTALQVDTPGSKAELGRLLFYDKRLSGDASTSCATCHKADNAWTDGIPLSAGYSRGNLYFRNTPTLLNASQMPLFDWDGRFAQGDISSLIRDHLAEAHFMNIDGRLLIERMRQVPEYEEAFKELFGSEVSYGKILDSLAAFLDTLTSQNHPYLRYEGGDTGALSPQAKAGLELFEGKAGCARCHSGGLLSDSEFYALGVPENLDIFQDPLRHITFRRFFRGFGVSEYVAMRDDPGLFALTLDDADRGKFRTPSLLEAARTAPYMHNGMLQSLEDVVRFYNQGGGDSPNKSPLLKPLGLTEAEIASVVAFLESLGSEEIPIEAPEQPDYQLRTLGEN